LIRTEATGYGLVYFVQEMLATKGDSFAEKTVVVSGSGNVAQYAIEKALHLGAKVVTASDSSGYVYDEAGFTQEKLDYLKDLKNNQRGRINLYAEKFGAKFIPNKTPWEVKCDIALPCAVQNELHAEDAKILIANGVIAVGEGANMPTTPEAIDLFHDAKILFSPGKASNAGGVATSGLEMSQNAMRLSWTSEEVDQKLQDIMKHIHAQCVQYGQETAKDGSGGDHINYLKGANIAGFKKVADAMIQQGIV
jgi:glutamate dehydrogenase (NADP+)